MTTRDETNAALDRVHHRLTCPADRYKEALVLAERALRDQPMQAFRTPEVQRRRAAALDAIHAALGREGVES